jgi:hypothetical protein
MLHYYVILRELQTYITAQILYLLHREVYWSRVLLKICNYSRTKCLLVIILKFLGLNHHLTVASTKFSQDPAMNQ